MDNRYIIQCAGEGSRWGNHLGVQKHHIAIDGETILNRTCRLLNNHIHTHDHIIVSGIQSNIDGVTSIIPKTNIDEDAYKFLSVEDYWSTDGYTTILFGDVFFSDEAINTIVNWNDNNYAFFGRYGKHKYTNCKIGEIFALKFHYSHNKLMHDAMIATIKERHAGKAKNSGGWRCYRYLQGIPLEDHSLKNNFISIDDITDDFDHPRDYDRWMKAYRKTHNDT